MNNAVVATPRELFGKGRVHDSSVRVTQPRELKNVQGALAVQPDSTSLVAGAPKGLRPPSSILSRPVVSTRPARESKLPWRAKPTKEESKIKAEQRLVPLPKRPANDLPRPQFGAETGAERLRPPTPPRFKERQRDSEPVPSQGLEQRVETGRGQPEPLRSAPPRIIQGREKERVSPEQSRSEQSRPAPRVVSEETQRQMELDQKDLPGKPANRMFRGKDTEKNKERRRSRE